MKRELETTQRDYVRAMERIDELTRVSERRQFDIQESKYALQVPYSSTMPRSPSVAPSLAVLLMCCMCVCVCVCVCVWLCVAVCGCTVCGSRGGTPTQSTTSHRHRTRSI